MVKIPNPKKEAEKWIKKIKDTANGAVNEVRSKGKWYVGEVERVGKKTTGKVEATGKKTVGQVEKTGKQAVSTAEKEIKSAERQAIKSLESEVGPAIERFIQDLTSAGMKPVLKQAAQNCRWLAEAMDTVAEEAPQMVTAINKVGYDVNLKVNVELDLEYKNFWTRSHEVAGILDRYANDGLALRRRDIRGFMIALGPDTIKFGGGASLSFGVDLGAVGKLKDLELDLFVLIADYVMKKMGIPE